MKRFLKLFFTVSVLFPTVIFSQIELPKIFTSNMVLPRDVAIPIQGKAQPKEWITVTIQSQEHKVKTDKKGNFLVTLNPLNYGGPFELIFKGNDTKTLTNILVGDLWLCSGQSNMQYSIKQIGYKEKDSTKMAFPKLRLGAVGIGTDYLPKDDLSLVYWFEGTIDNAQNFSATAWFYGRYLVENQDVPIGLVSSNLGATSIETWMSLGALKQFPQFIEVTNYISKTKKNFETLNTEFEQFRKKWDDKHYLKGIGLDEKWYADDFDDSNWETCKIPNFIDDLGYENFDGSFWFRKTFDLTKEQLNQDFTLRLSQIDDYDITWVNGQKVGETFGNMNSRNYVIPKDILREKGNTVAVRVFDVGGKGGMHTNAFWGGKIRNGEWKYKKGRQIDAKKFPTKPVPNGSPFSYPTLLYNGGIAPLHNFPIKGVIWYQGEANENRAVEYEQLLKGMITDWRAKWNNTKLPFYIVQLANYRAEDKTPKDSKWAEVRESQTKASELDFVDVITTIDVGEANDIHPKNKKAVGERLAMLSMHYDYGVTLKKSPSFKNATVEKGKIIIEMNTYGSQLKSLDKQGYLRGFAVATDDGKFQWAQAQIIDDTRIAVYSHTIKNPKYVRYAWSDNPGKLDLVNTDDLPAYPFRTDNFELSTAKETYTFSPHRF
ncbi:sialate O-acetylesterase [Flavobacteriaceae bacterium MAR_2010_72]|nr:sialate O-acetylesterase [Flavobacteriaceae bacterium MAR_2010_72]